MLLKLITTIASSFSFQYKIHQTISIVDNNQKTSSAPNKGKPTHFANKVIGNYTGGNQAPLSMRYNYRTKAQQNAVRIDTCIVGDDSTCDTAQNEMCKTDVGVSSCHCRPGKYFIIIIFIFCIHFEMRIKREFIINIIIRLHTFNVQNRYAKRSLLLSMSICHSKNVLKNFYTFSTDINVIDPKFFFFICLMVSLFRSCHHFVLLHFYCYCVLLSRIGYSRRKYRDPCRKVLSLLISIRVDRYYDKRIVWDKVFADNTSEQYEHLSYETVLAVNIQM